MADFTDIKDFDLHTVGATTNIAVQNDDGTGGRCLMNLDNVTKVGATTENAVTIGNASSVTAGATDARAAFDIDAQAVTPSGSEGFARLRMYNDAGTAASLIVTSSTHASIADALNLSAVVDRYRIDMGVSGLVTGFEMIHSGGVVKTAFNGMAPNEAIDIKSGNLRVTAGYADIREIAAPASPAANDGRIYVADDTGTTKLYFKDSAGTVTNLLVGTGEANTASNVGVGTGVFAQKSVADLEFKTLVAGTGIALTDDSTTVTITNDMTIDELGNPAGDKTFTMSNKTITWRFTNPNGGMNWEWTGNAQGHLMDIKQLTGTPSADTHLLHIDAAHVNATCLHLEHGNAAGVAMLIDGGLVTLSAVAAAVADPDKFLCLDGSNNLTYRTGAEVLSDIGAGTGTIGGATGGTDEAVLVADGAGGSTLKSTGVVIDSSNNVTGVVNLAASGYSDITEMAAPGNPAANVGRLYVADDGGTTTLYFKDSAGVATDLLAGGAGIGGATGGVDEAILMADGVGGSTLQASAATITNAGVITCIGLISTGNVTLGTNDLLILNSDDGSDLYFYSPSADRLNLYVGGLQALNVKSSNTNVAFNFRASYNGQTSVIGDSVAVCGVTPTHNGAGLNPLMMGLDTTMSLSAAGDVTDAISINIGSASLTSTGVPVNQYGLYIENQDDGSTTNHAIYTNNGLVRFGDRVINTAGMNTKVSTADVADPPTEANLVAAFGAVATVGEGFIGIVDDNSANTDVWLCYTSDTSWFYLQGTKAV